MQVFEKNLLDFANRVRIASFIIVLMFSVIIIRLWYLQVVHGDYYREKSENNRLRTVYMPAPRGLILDRNGTVLVKNRAAFDLEIVVEDTPNLDLTLQSLAKLINRDYAELKANYEKYKVKRKRFESRLILPDVERDLVAKVSANKIRLPGVIVSVRLNRDYVKGNFASHLLGYVREITAKELENKEYVDYRSGEKIGKSGIEKIQEYLLRGSRGIRKITVNALGTRIGESIYTDEIPGQNVVLTIDERVQSAAEQALKDKTGAVIAIDPNSGEVIAMTSSPSYDPNVFTKPILADYWAQYFDGPEKRLVNRTLQDTYPPGSVFKFIMSVAALAEGVADTHESINCHGSFSIGGGRPFNCHKKSGHGATNLLDALKQSCNVYFYTLGQRLGIDRIYHYATMFGLGMSTDIGFAEEVNGLIPSPEWKAKTFKDPSQKKWYPGETPSVSIGQGAVSLTLIQIARAMSALVNGGTLYKPYLIKSIKSETGPFNDVILPVVQSTIPVDRKILNTVKDALVSVVNQSGGTGSAAKLKPELGITVGGKTGTAQKAALNSELGKIENAWFAGFAPADKPRLVVIVLVEGGGHGGVAAAPVAKQVMEAYFDTD